tara:strand:+ start:484 stop:1305 length:822 start_codon:yes stop_codon:yes gene_type:complete
MALPIEHYTITYDEGVQGFPSFYSYNPEWMIGMNNYFYSFKGGNIYRHNTNDTRNNYYGVNYRSEVTSVFNDNPLENKLFKTLNIEGDASWGATLISDQQTTGYVDNSWWQKKEGSYFGFIRNSGTVPANQDQYPLRSVNGLATSSNITVAGNSTTVDFSTSISIGNIISIGDMVYFAVAPIAPATAYVPQLLGQVISVNQNLASGINSVVVDNTIGGAQTSPSPNEYILYIKNAVAESHGILGHYGQFTLINNSTSKIELVALESEVMKSFP